MVSLFERGEIWGRIPTLGMPSRRAWAFEITTLRRASRITACTRSGPPTQITTPTPVLNLAVTLAGGSPYRWKTFEKSKSWFSNDGATPRFTLGMSSHGGTSRTGRYSSRFATKDTSRRASTIVDLPALFRPTITVNGRSGMVWRLKHLKFSRTTSVSISGRYITDITSTGKRRDHYLVATHAVFFLQRRHRNAFRTGYYAPPFNCP